MSARATLLAAWLTACAAADPAEPTAVGGDQGAVDALMAVVGLDARSRDAALPDDAVVEADVRFADAALRPDARPPPDGPDARVVLDAAPPPLDAAPPLVDAAPMPLDANTCVAETCNGLDDDCDTRIDEDAVCGAFIETRCSLTLGWADNNGGPGGLSPTWSTCPGQDRQMAGDVRCTSTRQDGLFVRLDLNGDVDDNDQLGLALRCDDAAFPAVADWIGTHCAAYLGHADNNGGRAGAASWGACPPAPASDAIPRCTSSGMDGMFRAMRLAGDVDGNDDLGIAWICSDPNQPQRAAAAQGAAEVQLAWSDDNRGLADGAANWGFVCPGRRDNPRQACTATLGDGGFHAIDLAGDVDDNDDLGIALKRR